MSTTVKLTINLDDGTYEIMKAIAMFYHRPVKMQIEFMVHAEAEKWKGPGFEPPTMLPDTPFSRTFDLQSIGDTVE